jgi:hypothetical protein
MCVTGEAKRLDGLPGRIDIQFRPEPHPGQATAGQTEPGKEESRRPERCATVFGYAQTEKIAKTSDTVSATVSATGATATAEPHERPRWHH